MQRAAGDAAAQRRIDLRNAKRLHAGDFETGRAFERGDGFAQFGQHC
jgi:hypothetical protein